MGAWAGYWGIVVRRAWRETCAVMLPDSWKIAARDGLILLAATGAMFLLRGPLAERGIIGRADNPALDNLIPVMFGLAALVAIFAAYFVAEALFVSPFRVHQERVGSEPAAKPDGPEPFHARQPSYALWDMIDPLDLYQVACLWIDLAPPDSPDVELVGDASASLYALQRAVEQGALAATYDHLGDFEKASLRIAQVTNPGKQPPATKTTRFTRNALRAYATNLGTRPRFLFPEDRANGVSR